MNTIEKQWNDYDIVSTLGPEGTCSEYAASYFILKNNLKAKVVLYSSFEEAAEAVNNGTADYVIVPSAYKKLAEIIFQNCETLEITDVFKLNTLELVLAGSGQKEKIKKIAAHTSPSSLINQIVSDAELVHANSNSDAARMLANYEVDACLTTASCVERYSFSTIHSFGSVVMGWNVLKKK